MVAEAGLMLRLNLLRKRLAGRAAFSAHEYNT